MECEINNVLNLQTKPTLVKFENGELIKGQERHFKSFYLKNNKKENLLAVENEKMLYTGKISNQNSLYNNCILIRDKRTNKVTLIEVNHAILSPYIPKSEDVLDATSSPGKKSVYELNKQFGSKKTKRQTEQHERLKMDVENVKEQLEKTVAGIKIDENSTVIPQVNENDSLYRPPMDRSASTREQVYVIETLIPKSILKTLKSEAQKIYEEDNLDSFSYLTPFVKEQIKNISQANSPKANIKKVQLLLYVNFLIKFVVVPAKNIKNAPFCGQFEDVRKHILENFSIASRNNRLRPLSMRDKVLCYILVLSLICSDYQLKTDALCPEVSLGRNKLREIARVLGMTTGSSKDTLTLKIPLPPPVSFSPKRKRK